MIIEAVVMCCVCFGQLMIMQVRTNIQVYQTIDQGATWDLISNRGLQTEIDTTGLTLQRITGAATASQCVLFLEAFKSSGTNRNFVLPICQCIAGHQIYIRGTIARYGYHIPSTPTQRCCVQWCVCTQFYTQ